MEALREEQKQVVLDEPHGVHIDPDGQPIPFWDGLRQVDEQQLRGQLLHTFSKRR